MHHLPSQMMSALCLHGILKAKHLRSHTADSLPTCLRTREPRECNLEGKTTGDYRSLVFKGRLHYTEKTQHCMLVLLGQTNRWSTKHQPAWQWRHVSSKLERPS
mmetsp:Transcript_104685/g.337530  ORF Transcript_104685/g.337530 Transcript_104685/m.337530 type:complete len:104 (+) Transcript_104685:251-562(+)